jgi:hypothetical protein
LTSHVMASIHHCFWRFDPNLVVVVNTHTATLSLYFLITGTNQSQSVQTYLDMP